MTTRGPVIVKLNVGGQRFVTTAETLRLRGPNFLSQLVDNDLSGAISSFKDEEGTIHLNARYYFVDRNGKLFEAVLDYLRSGDLIVPPHATEQQIRAELDFYSIQAPESLPKSNQLQLSQSEIEDINLDPGFGQQIRDKYRVNSVRGFLQKNLARIREDIKAVAPLQPYIQLVWCWSRVGAPTVVGLRFMGTDTHRPDCFVLNRLLYKTLGLGACSSSFHYFVDHGNRETSITVYAIRVYWDLTAMQRYIQGENEAILEDNLSRKE